MQRVSAAFVVSVVLYFAISTRIIGSHSLNGPSVTVQAISTKTSAPTIAQLRMVQSAEWASAKAPRAMISTAII